MLKIRRPLGRLIFNMGIAIPGKTVFLIESAPRFLWLYSSFHVDRFVFQYMFIYNATQFWACAHECIFITLVDNTVIDIVLVFQWNSAVSFTKMIRFWMAIETDSPFSLIYWKAFGNITCQNECHCSRSCDGEWRCDAIYWLCLLYMYI